MAGSSRQPPAVSRRCRGGMVEDGLRRRLLVLTNCATVAWLVALAISLLRREDAGEDPSLLGTMSMAFLRYFLSESDISCRCSNPTERSLVEWF